MAQKRNQTNLEFFKANARKEGSACAVSFNSAGGAIYFTLIKQVGWDDMKKKGSFSGGEKTTIKISPTEAAAIISAIRTKTKAPWGKDGKTYHKNESHYSYIEFSPIDKDGNFIGYGLQINQGSNVDSSKKSLFKIWFNAAEAVLLEQYLVFSLEHIFSAWYSEGKKQAIERKNNAAKKPDKQEDATDEGKDGAEGEEVVF